MKPCKNKLSLSVINLRPLDAGSGSVQCYSFETAPQNKAKNNTPCMALSSAAANGLPPEEMVGLASAVALWFWQEARPRVSSL